MPLPFRELWIGWDIPGVRPTDGSYAATPISALPRLDVADDLSWLTPIDPHVISRLDGKYPPGAGVWAPFVAEHEALGDDAPGRWRTQVDRIVAQAMEAQVRLPDAFVALFRSDRMRARVLDPTGCNFELADQGLSPDPFGLGGCIVRFLSDQQDCVTWYLLARPSAPAVVLASSETPDARFLENLDPANAAGVAAAMEQTSVAAWSFPEFLYRFWIEGALWFKRSYDIELSPPEADYLRRLTPQ